MGINLGGILPKKEISIDDLSGKRIAIDASLMLYQFLSSIRQKDGTLLMDSNGNITSHLVGINSRVTNLMQKGLKLCFVFDGEPPKLKEKEKENRSKRKDIAREKFAEAEEEGDIDRMNRYSKQTIKLSWEMCEEAKELIKAFGLPVIEAPSEAEAQASQLCKEKSVWAVGSNDVDSLLFGTPRLIQNLTLSNRRRLPSGLYKEISPQLIELKEVLDSLEINKEELILLGILVGTDYNKEGAKGIGPKKALKLVHENKPPKEIFSQYEVEHWEEIIEIFDNIKVKKEVKLEWKEIDEGKVKKILVDEHDFNEDRVNKMLERIVGKDKHQKGLKEWF